MIHKETLLVNKMLSFEVNHQHLSAYWKNLLEACTSPILLVLFFILVFKNVAKMWFCVIYHEAAERNSKIFFYCSCWVFFNLQYNCANTWRSPTTIVVVLCFCCLIKSWFIKKKKKHLKRPNYTERGCAMILCMMDLKSLNLSM